MAGRHRAVSKRGKALRGLPVAVALPAAIAFGVGPGTAQAAEATVAHLPDTADEIATEAGAPHFTPTSHVEAQLAPIAHAETEFTDVLAAQPISRVVPTAQVAAAQPGAVAEPVAAAAPIASPIENATFLGSTAGQVIGGLAGAGLGAAGGAALASPLAVPTGGVAVPVGAVAGGVIGGVAGTYAGYYVGAYLGTIVAQQAPHLIPAVLP
ncbi:hypothetical protein FEK33_24710 [Nocardia asteroides NBRC 15531]|uniref:hypothetical protein n=1 Tax=Nocardia asteroides TaxID=1824 RepID=UPI000F83EC25|nr:hypothetical protein [Nocardia asteroides]TLF63263.1 hypothetical protein FEK33_24710 [Nocardia asteroides NBRC 15531]UGT47327.1 hypothetical protein LT345_22830 [Nocardia asteroides]